MKPLRPRGRRLAGPHPLDPRQRRGLLDQPREERVDVGGGSLDVDHDAALVVADAASEVQLAGEAVHERAEADPLDGSLDAAGDPAALARGGGGAHSSSTSSRRTCQALAWASWMRGMCSERVTTTWSARRSEAIRPPS